MKTNDEYKITIIRKKEINNRFRKISIIVNDKKQEKLMNIEKVLMFKEENPQIKLKAKIDWCTSPDIYLSFDKNKSNKKVIISSQISDGYIIIIFIMGIIGVGLSMHQNTWLYMIPFFILYFKPLYYITIGRNNYLKIDEI